MINNEGEEDLELDMKLSFSCESAAAADLCLLDLHAFSEGEIEWDLPLWEYIYMSLYIQNR